MRKYNYKKYIELLEKTSDFILQKHMQAEIEEVLKVQTPQCKTFIDLGAGHGRVLPILAKIAGSVISIELNPGMLPELKRRTKQFNNTEMIIGNITRLSNILKNKDIKTPVLLLLQNTLGTIEGDWEKVLSEMKKVAQENYGEIIISLFRSEALRFWGTSKLYSSTSEIVGEIDSEKTDFKNGIFVSKTGYSSKWRNKKEIEEIKKEFQGKLVNEVWTNEFYILHIQYPLPK